MDRLIESAELGRVSVDDADLAQLVEYVERYLNIELGPVERSSRSKLLAKLDTAGQTPKFIPFVERVVSTAPTQTADALGEWDEENERWVKFRIQPGAQSDADMPVPVAVNDVQVHFRRGVAIVARERFYRHLIQSRETRVEQEENQRFSEAVRYEVDCYPTSFFGSVGLVKDGPPDRKLLEGSVFYPTRG